MASSQRSCIVAGCATKSNTSNVFFHHLPTNKTVRSLWIAALLPHVKRKIFNHSNVCDLHFTAQDFTDGTIPGLSCFCRLRHNAVPSIFPLPLLTAGQPLETAVVTEEQRSGGETTNLTSIEPAPRIHTCEAARSTMEQSSCASAVQPTIQVTAVTGSLDSVITTIEEMEVTPRTRNVGTQCDLYCMRSKGIQVKPPTKDRATWYRCRAKRKLFGQTTSTPAKRLRFSPVVGSPIDATYSPGTSFDTTAESTSNSFASVPETNVVVSKEKLVELLSSCSSCSRSCELTETWVGSLLKVNSRCTRCHTERKWQSQESIDNVPSCNILISACIYFTGNSFRKINKFLTSMNVRTISETTYYKIVKKYIQPAIFTHWERYQEGALAKIRDAKKPLVLSGDMRADSPGHSAKYGSYSLMDTSNNKILHFELIQSNEVGGSARMEKEGLVRCFAALAKNDVEVSSLITDRHPSIQKYMREEQPQVEQLFDVWHVAKGLSKKLGSSAIARDCAELQPWCRSITNHLYWVATESPTGEEAVSRWKSLANHVCGIHQHDDELFPQCLHEELQEDGRTKGWLVLDSKPWVRLEKIILDKRLLKAIPKLSGEHQTSALESFHSLVLQFAPKSRAFSFKGMLCRLMLAAFHFNENSHRCPVLDPVTLQPKLKVRHPKRKKGGYSFSLVKQSSTTKYVQELLQLLFEEVWKNTEAYGEKLRNLLDPEPLNARLLKPTPGERKKMRRYGN